MSGTAGARVWLRKADNDLLNIENNLRADDVPWDTICFHAQQAAEKALKAVLVESGINPPRTHDLVTLLTRCVPLQPELAALEADCVELTVYGVASRYPDAVIDPGAEDGRAMAAAARRVREVVGRLLEA
jgi:HEPN domain-containing protein